ncbi:prevent-host-death protein [Chlorobaculum parvum NCIB 8327]|uniref:Prevent-host-death protein n=2 Tax=Chlorobaculum parvum TaxID=274539 RepID=B3QM02_CHLP8|nr:prevent-host-death protein [Chlorobaculum parvum NCIB 8327]
MSELLKKIESEVLGLSHQERAFLADRLLSSLGEDVLTEFDAAWVTEAQRRYGEYKAGRRSGIDAQEVFAEADRIVE